jgi:hypothetical protein
MIRRQGGHPGERDGRIVTEIDDRVVSDRPAENKRIACLRRSGCR